MSSGPSEISDRREDVAGVPPAAVCEARASQALRAAAETKLSNVRELYRRSALRWSELADQKITETTLKG